METTMDLFTRQHLHDLIDVHDDPCISIYIPTHRAAPETAQDPIRFKNMLRTAIRELEQEDLASRQIREQFETAESYLADDNFWQHQSDGLAVFLTEQDVRRFRLPRTFQEHCRIDDHFYVNPLLPLLQSNGVFYVLAVSQNSCRLLVADRDAIQELEEANLPTDLRSALGWWRESELNFHSMQRKPASRGGDDTAVYHGHQEEKKETDLQAYFRKIDVGVTDALRGETAPLIFAGVEYLFPLYAGVNSYAGLCEQAVTGNPDDLSAEELHRRAWGIVQPLFEARQHQALSEFMQRSSQGTATDDVATVLTAARDGLVETLIIPRRAELRGRFDAETGQVEFEEGEDSDDLFDRAVLFTLKTSGEVLSVDQDAMPNDASAVALLRAPHSAVAI